MVEYRPVLLARIAAELTAHPAELAGDARVKGDAVIAAEDRLWVEVDLLEVEPGKAHVHVFAMLGDAALEACTMGHASTLEEALADAARVWAHTAGAPILSVLAARPLGTADHFHGTEPWGVAGCHGFVGPIALRAGTVDPQPFVTMPLFAGHAFDLDDRELHIIKAVLMGKGGRWHRILELDGHSDHHVDAWPDGPACPDGEVLMLRFAIVLGRAAATVAVPPAVDGNQLVATVRATLPMFVRGVAMNDAQLIEALERVGYPRDLASALVELVPTAFFRAEMADSGIQFSPYYQRVLERQKRISRTERLDDVPLYTAALEVARGGIGKRKRAAAGNRSAERDLVHQMPSRGDNQPDIVLEPIWFIDDPDPADGRAAGRYRAVARAAPSPRSNVEPGKLSSLLEQTPRLPVVLLFIFLVLCGVVAVASRCG